MDASETKHPSDLLCPLHNIAALWRHFGDDFCELGDDDPITVVRRDALIAAVEATARTITECTEKVEAWERGARTVAEGGEAA